MSRFVGDKVDARTGNIIERFDSCALAAIPLFLQGISISSVKRISDGILSCAKGKFSSLHGYKWLFVEDWTENWEE